MKQRLKRVLTIVSQQQVLYKKPRQNFGRTLFFMAKIPFARALTGKGYLCQLPCDLKFIICERIFCSRQLSFLFGGSSSPAGFVLSNKRTNHKNFIMIGTAF